MQSAYRSFTFSDSIGRIDEILNESEYSYQEVDSIPDRSRLTFTNGFYVNCTSLFVDIRDSSKLTESHRRPTLAKIYRAFISEMVAVMNNSIWCKEVNIVGDCVSGIFDTPSSTDIDAVFGTAASLSSIIDALNSRLNRFNISTIEVGIGIDYGRALMIKAGYKGSGINDVVWMGDVVNKASHLSGLGSKTFIPAYQYWQEKYGRIVVSPTIYNNLNDHNRGLLKFNNNVYHGNIVNTVLDNAIKALSI